MKALLLKALLFCRVSSEEQTKGFSLDTQEDGGGAYAAKHGIEIVKTFRVAESASTEGREVFNEAVRLIKASPNVSIFLVFKMDRILRNLQDMALVDELARRFDKQIHFFHEGWTYTKDSTIADFYRFGFMSVMATGFSRNLSDITKIGMRKKAESGQFPAPAPYGYRNNPETRRLEIDPAEKPWVIRIKELAAAGVSVDRIIECLAAEGCPDRFVKSKIARIIESTFYIGLFQWGGETWRGAYPLFIPQDLHDEGVRGLKRLNKTRRQTRSIDYRGLIKCGACGAAISGEWHKNKYVYYRCRQRCPGSVYVEERELDQQIDDMISRIRIDPDAAAYLISNLEEEQGQETVQRESRIAILRGEHTRLKNRLDRAYEDKLDGRLEESEWMKCSREWKEKLLRVEAEIAKAESAGPGLAKIMRHIVELVGTLKIQFKSLPAEKKGEIADCVLSNSSLTSKTLSLTYEKPWDAIVEIAEKMKMGPGRDDVRTLQAILLDSETSVNALWGRLH